MNLVEMKQSVDMLYDEWDLGKTPSHSKGKICAWIYLFEILEETEKMVIEKEQSDFSRPLFLPIWVSEWNEEISKAIAIIAYFIY